MTDLFDLPSSVGAISPTFLHDELIVDNFAGGGGASTGIEAALGRSPDIAINHDAQAILMHEANHPGTLHLREDVWKVDPLKVTQGRRVGLAWFSPDCKHFSKAKGGKPRSKKIRGLAWVMVKWCAVVKPRVCVLENVEEFQTWGPLLADGNPCPKRKGKTFKSFIKRLTNLGYEVQWRELRACDYGAPTIRKRLFLIARCDGQPIVWPEVSHGHPRSPEVLAGALLPWRTAAECIDWSLPCHSIFLTREEGRQVGAQRPLAEATMRRIARGLKKFVLDAKEPFIVPQESQPAQHAPFLTEHANASNQRTFAAAEPLRTQCAEVKGGHFALVTAFLAKHFGGGYTGPGADVAAPMSTVTTRDHHALVQSSFLSKFYGTTTGQAQAEPMATITANGQHLAEVRAFFVKYYGNEETASAPCHIPLHTVTTKERMGLVTVHGQDYEIADIGMRMLSPKELFRAQGFPSSYNIAPLWKGKPLTLESQVRMCGNSVPPPVAAAIVAANVPELRHHSKAA